MKRYESVASPTVSLDSAMTTLLIGAYEVRKFIPFNMPVAFLQAEMAEDKLILFKLKEEVVNMMRKIKPEFLYHIRYETIRY